MQTLTQMDEIETFLAENPFTFLYLSQRTCGVCKALLPKIEEVLKKYPNLKSSYIETNDTPEAVGKFSVFTIPVLLMYVDGREVMRKARFVSVDEVKAEIAKYNEIVEEWL